MRLYRLRRHPFGFWLFTFLLAGLAYTTVARAGDRADAAERRWGRVAGVVVVRRPVAQGAVVRGADVGVVSMPGRLVPAGALASASDAVGREALVALWPGEVLLRGRLAPDGLSGVAALLPPGWRAVAVPAGEGGLRLAVGDAVDVLATFPTDPASGDPTVAVASGALVVEVRADAVTLAVPPESAARVAYALARATLTLTLTPDPPGSSPPGPPPRSGSSPSTAEGQVPDGGR